MAGTSAQQTDGEVWALVAKQHGVVSRRQLLGLGFTSAAVEHRARTGRLRPVTRGVYAVGRPRLNRFGRWMAAVLACGDGAVVSHSSAAALWEMGPEWGRGVEVSVQGRCPRRAGLVVHRRRGLGPADLTVHRGIPVTSPALTLLDHGCRLGRSHMERMINAADKLNLIKQPELRVLLDAHPRRDGVGRLKAILDRRGFVYTEPGLEEAFLPLAASAGLPTPLTQQ